MRISAEKFLTTMLLVRRVPVTSILEAAEDLGISTSALRSARERLGVKVVREGFPAETVWYLEDQKPTGEELAEAEVLLAMWEYQAALRKLQRARKRIDDLKRVWKLQVGRTVKARPTGRFTSPASEDWSA